MYNKSIVRTENESPCNPNEMSNPALHDIIATNHVMLTKKAHATRLSSACKAAVLMITFIMVAIGIIVLTLVLARVHNNVADGFTQFDAMKPRLVPNNSRSGSLDSESLTTVANEQTENENWSQTTVILTSSNLHMLATQNIHMSSSVMGAQQNEHISPHTQLMKTYPSLDTIANEQSTISTTIQTTVYNQPTTFAVDSHHYTNTMTIEIEPKIEKSLTNDKEFKAENDLSTVTEFKVPNALSTFNEFKTENDVVKNTESKAEKSLPNGVELRTENGATTESSPNLDNDLNINTEPKTKDDLPEKTESKVEKDLLKDVVEVKIENNSTTKAQFKLDNNLTTDTELRTENALTITTPNQDYIHRASENPISSIDEDDSTLSQDYTTKIFEPTSFTTFLNRHFNIQVSTVINDYEHERAHANDTMLENDESNTTEEGITDNRLFS